MTNIEYCGKTIGFKTFEDGQFFIRTRKRIGIEDACPLCLKPFTADNTTSVILVVSNQAGIPNRFCHTECTADKTLEYVVQIIAASYARALKAVEELKQSGWHVLLSQA